MNKLLLYFLLLPFIGLSQTTYKSLASEYYYLNYDGQSKIEWIERDIIICEETIVVKSKGKEVSDIQTWSIQNKTEILFEGKTLDIINVHLASGEEHEFPATFTIFHEPNGKVEVISCEIPPNSQMKLADGSPITVRFLID